MRVIFKGRLLRARWLRGPRSVAWMQHSAIRGPSHRSLGQLCLERTRVGRKQADTERKGASGFAGRSGYSLLNRNELDARSQSEQNGTFLRSGRSDERE